MEINLVEYIVYMEMSTKIKESLENRFAKEEKPMTKKEFLEIVESNTSDVQKKYGGN